MATNSKDTFTERNPYLVYSDEFEDTKTDIMEKFGIMLEDTAITLSSEAVRAFDTVTEMQACTSLIVGMICHTNGFHAAGDGGAAFYKVTATGTANGMDVLACGDVFANLVITESYVTPEMFGAYGDGTHDDTDAFEMAIEAGNVHLGAKTYCIYDAVFYTSNREIRGNGAILNHGARTGIVLSRNVHDVLINGVDFVGTYEPGTDEYANAGIAVQAASATALYESYNIVVENCSFNGGVFGITATSVMNLEICNCVFGSFVYKTATGAGGYGILTQSCIDVNIHDCNFNRGDYGRHDIYVSVSQSKTDNVKSVNFDIRNCVFDCSGMDKQDSGAFYSPNTVCINVRYIDNLKVANCVGYSATGIVSFTSTDGAIVNAIVENIVSIDPRFIASTIGNAETRATINMASNDSSGSLKLSNIRTVNPDTNLYMDAALAGGRVTVENTTINYLITISNVAALYVKNCTYDSSGLKYTGTDVLYGYISGSQPKTAASITAITATNNGVLHPSLFPTEYFGAFVINNSGNIASNNSKVLIPYTYALTSNTFKFTLDKFSVVPMFVSASSAISTPKLYGYDINATNKTIVVRPYDITGTALTSGSLASRVTFHI